MRAMEPMADGESSPSMGNIATFVEACARARPVALAAANAEIATIASLGRPSRQLLIAQLNLHGAAGDVNGVERVWSELVALRLVQHVERSGGGGATPLLGDNAKASESAAAAAREAQLEVERTVLDLSAHRDRVKGLARALAVSARDLRKGTDGDGAAAVYGVRAVLDALDAMDARVKYAMATTTRPVTSVLADGKCIGVAFAAAMTTLPMLQTERDPCELALSLWLRATVVLGAPHTPVLLNALLLTLTRAGVESKMEWGERLALAEWTTGVTGGERNTSNGSRAKWAAAAPRIVIEQLGAMTTKREAVPSAQEAGAVVVTSTSTEDVVERLALVEKAELTAPTYSHLLELHAGCVTSPAAWLPHLAEWEKLRRSGPRDNLANVLSGMLDHYLVARCVGSYYLFF